MPKHNIEKKKEKEKLKQILNDLSQAESVSEDDLQALNEFIHDVISKRSDKKSFFFNMVRIFIRKFIFLYILSLLGFGFLSHYIVLSDNYHIFYVALGFCLGISIIEMFPLVCRNSRHGNFLFYLLFFINIILWNRVYPVFEFSSIWVIYFLIVEIMHHIFITWIVKRLIL